MSKVISTILLTLIWINSFAQNFNSDIEKANNFYLNNPRVSMDVSTSIIDAKSKKVISSSKGYLKKDGKKVKVSDGNIIQLFAEDFILFVDLGQKQIYLSQEKANYGTQVNSATDFVMQLTNMILNSETVSETGNVVKYNLILNNPDYESMSISIDRDIYCITEITIYDRKLNQDINNSDNNKITIIKYSNINTNPDFSKNEFSLTEYLTKQGNSYIPKGNYSSFEFFEDN